MKEKNKREIDLIDLNAAPDRKKAAVGSGRKSSGCKKSTQKARSRKSAESKKRKADDSGRGFQRAYDEKTLRPTGKRRAAADAAENREFAVVMYIFLALFFSLMAYFIYYVGFRSETFINSPYNPRLALMEEHTVRGAVISSDGKVLAETKTDSAGNESRVYPYGNEYAHAVGFCVNGMSGVELDANFSLLRSHEFFLTQLTKQLKDEKTDGDKCNITIDSALQDAAYEGMGSYKGAVIAIEPSTGKILAMVSKPDFDPNTVADKWDSLTTDDTSVLLNRATQGLYPPGSTGKIFTALEYLEEGNDPAVTYDCEGTYTRDGFTIHCYNSEVHGEEDLAGAFADSCNTTFARMGLTLDPARFTALSTRMLFNKTLPTKLQNVSRSSFSLSAADSDASVMQTSIGQGKTLVTPIHMAMVSAAIANGGVVMEPYMIDSIESVDSSRIRRCKGTEYGTVMTEEEAGQMKALMRGVVENGTGTKLQSDLYTAYGKTGTAEFTDDKNRTHSWFTGFAEKDGKQVAIAVLMEDSGTSSKHAVPLAKKCFDAYFAN